MTQPPVFAAKCEQEARDASQQYEHEQYDLAAQRTSAWWTKLMGIAAILATVLSAVGVALIYRTFRHTQEQGDEVRQSLIQSTRTATAMEGVAVSTEKNVTKVAESVAHQERFGKMQMRAYVSVLIGKGLYQDDNFVFEVRPRLLNTGNTPAKNVQWRIAMGILSNDQMPGNFRFPVSKTVVGGSDLPPQQDGFMSVVHDTRLDAEMAEAVKRGIGQSCYAWGIVWYWDVFGERHHTSFAQRVWWEPTGLDPKGQIILGLGGQYLPCHNRGN